MLLINTIESSLLITLIMTKYYCKIRSEADFNKQPIMALIGCLYFVNQVFIISLILLRIEIRFLKCRYGMILQNQLLIF